MKWNWGTGIFIVIVLFLGACAAFIIYSQGQKWSMVEEDYYPKELRHEEKLVKMRNANSLVNPLTITMEQSNVVIRFPGEFKGKELKGKIDFYRPSDESLDLVIPIVPDTALIQLIPLRQLSRGRYVVKVEWSSDGKDFFKEQDIFIP